MACSIAVAEAADKVSHPRLIVILASCPVIPFSICLSRAKWSPFVMKLIFD